VPVTAPSLAVTVLGSDGSYPGPGGACSGYLIGAGDVVVWLDAGTGTLANLQRHAGLADVDAIVLSHAHADHWTDIEGYYVACRYYLGRRSVPVYAPAGLSRLPRGVDDDGTFVWHQIADGSRLKLGPLDMRFSRTDHPVETLAVRVQAGDRALGYSADTGPAWSLSELGSLDLALVEASFLAPHEGRAQHLSARQAGMTAREAGARRLVITHIGPTVQRPAAQAEAESTFGQPVDAALISARYVA
jgi:ribonuclease BN (tRNA processing enzyme)